VLLSSWISLELVQLSIHLPGRCISIIKNSLKDWGQVRDVRPRDASSRSELNVLSIHRHVRFGMNDASSWGIHFSERRNDLTEFHRPKKQQLLWRHANLFLPHTHTYSQIFLLPTTISYNTEKCFQRERWIGIDRSYFTTVILLRKKRWSARNKLSKTAWKMRSYIGIIRDSTWNHLEQFAYRGTWMRNGSKFITVVCSNRIHVIQCLERIIMPRLSKQLFSKCFLNKYSNAIASGN